MQKEGTEGQSVEEADDEMCVELESDELDSHRSLLHDAANLVAARGDTAVGEITSDQFENTTAALSEASISVSSDSTIGYDDDDNQSVSSSVQPDRTLSDSETSATELGETITACNRNEEGGVSSESSGGDQHLCSGDERVLPVHSVPMMEVETTGGQADDISTSATELVETITACNRNEEGGTSSETISSGGDQHLCSGDERVLPVHSVPVMEVETTGGQADDISSITESSSVQPDHTLSDAETSATELVETITTCNRNEEGGTSSETVMEVETTGGQADDISSITDSSVVSDVIPGSSGLNTSCCHEEVQSLSSSETTCTVTDAETSAAEPSETAVHYGNNRNGTILSCTTASDIGVHLASDNENFTEISQAESVNLQNLSVYTGLKFPRIVLTPVDVMDVSSTCVRTSSAATLSLSETSEAPSLLPSAEESHSLPEDSVTADTPCTVTSAKEDSVLDGVSTVAVVDNSQAFDSSVSAAAEFAYRSVGLKRAHDDDSVEGFSPKQQKTDDNSSSLSQHTNDDVSDAHRYVNTSQSSAEHSMNTEASAPTAVFNVEAVEKTDANNSQQCVPTDSDISAAEDVTIEAVEKTDTNNCQQCVPTDSDISAAEDATIEWLVVDQVTSMIDAVAAGDNPLAPEVVTTEEPRVDVESSVNDAKVINDHSPVPDSSDVGLSAPIHESGLDVMKNSELLTTDVLAGKISGVPVASRALILPPPPTVTKNAGSKMRMRMEAANKDKLPASATVKKYQKNRSATIVPKVTSVRTSDADAQQTTAASNKEVEISMSASEIGPSADDKPSCELSESVPASATVEKYKQNRSETIAAKVTSVGTEQTTAVSNKEVEIIIPASEMGFSVDDKPLSELSEKQSSDEKKAEPLLEWRPPPTKSAALKDVVVSNIPAVEGGVTPEEKSSSKQICDEGENQKQREFDAGGKKVKQPLMDWQPPVSWKSPYHPSSPTDSASVIEWKPAPSCRPKSAPLEVGKEAVSNIEPSISPVRFLSECTPFCPPQNVNSGQPPAQNVNSGQPSLQVALSYAPAVHLPLPIQPNMMSPPPLNYQVPPSVAETVPGRSVQPSPPGGIVLNNQTQTPRHVMPATPPRVMPADCQPPPAFYSPPRQSVIPGPAPNISPQSRVGPSLGQPAPPGIVLPVAQPPPQMASVIPPGPAPNISPQSQVGPSLGQPAPPGIVLPVAQPPPQMAPVVPHSRPPLLSNPVQGPPPPAVRFDSNRPPNPGMVPPPQPVQSPQPVPPPHLPLPSPARPPPEQFHPPHAHGPPLMGPPPHAPPRWGPVPPPHAGPPMWGPHQGIPPPGFNQPYPAMHGPAVPQEWQPPPVNPPGAPYMQPGLHNVNWRPPVDYLPPDEGWWGAPAPAGVPQWGPPQGPPDWSYSGQPQPGTGGDSQTGGDDAKTASLAQAAREWAEWQQRYSEWYYTYYGYSGPPPDAIPAANTTIVMTSVPTKASFSGKRVSNSSSSAPAAKTSSAANRTSASASSVMSKASFTEKNVSKNAAIPLPSGPPVPKPGTADAFAKFAERAASNINLALGMSTNKPPQNTASEPVSSTTNVSSTSVKPSEGECLQVLEFCVAARSDGMMCLYCQKCSYNQRLSTNRHCKLLITSLKMKEDINLTECVNVSN